MLKRVIILTIILSLVFLSVLGIVYLFIVNSFDIDQGAGKVNAFLGEIKEETNISFSEERDVFFNWGISKEKEMIYIRGEKISVNDATKEDRDKVIRLLQEKGFEESKINLIDSEEMKVIGYRENNIACIIESNYEEGVIKNMILLCGKIKEAN